MAAMTIRPKFDTAKYLGTLTDAGMPDAQARAQTAAFAEAMEEIADTFATKDRLELAIERFEARLEGVRADLTRGQESLRADFSEKLRLQGWAMLAGITALIVAATAIIKLTP